MDFVQIINTLKETSGNNAKVDILKAADETTKKVLNYTYNPMITFGIKKIPKYTFQYTVPLSMNYVFTVLEDLRHRRITGNNAINTLQWVLSNLPSEQASIVEGIIARDLRINMGPKLINKAIPNLIPIFELMACHTLNANTSSHLKYPCLVQLKYDAARVCVVVQQGNVTYFTRNGKDYGLNNPEMDAIFLAGGNDWVYDGELYSVDADGNVRNRQISNGIANKLIKGTAKAEDHASIRIALWDVITYEEFEAGRSPVKYVDRFDKVLQVAFNQTLVEAAETYSCNNIQEVINHAIRYIQSGKEGVIAKNLDGEWVRSRVNHCLKVKAEIESDLRIVGYEEGTGKNAGRLGNWIFESEGGELKVNNGIFKGYSEDIRDEWWKVRDAMIGKIAVVLHNGAISDVNGEYSVFLPRVIEIRDDKTEADTLEKIIEDTKGGGFLKEKKDEA